MCLCSFYTFEVNLSLSAIAIAGPVGSTIAGLSIIASGLMFFKTKNDKERLENVYTLISNRDVKSYELAIPFYVFS